MHAILPKIGLNRHTPRVLIYGPQSLGGLEIMDVRIEQVAIQWETTIDLMRRKDRTGKGIYITANDLQIELGTSYPFFELDLKDYNYIKGRRRWEYLWSTAKTLDLKIFENDKNIMEVAMADEIV